MWLVAACLRVRGACRDAWQCAEHREACASELWEKAEALSAARHRRVEGRVHGCHNLNWQETTPVRLPCVLPDSGTMFVFSLRRYVFCHGVRNGTARNRHQVLPVNMYGATSGPI
uniref:Uncharacterized protein n=1 Tax=Toxoplasma gondii (strain ATCC 50861 / VEG) TaxID=432359 RepID=A0A0F7UPH5_TOXGV|nr:TPA: hypothetical protein BN1205_055230 [Toxoplasma gondii VEG]